LDYLFVNILEGTGGFRVGENAFHVSAGDQVWIPPDVLHEMEGFAPGTRIQYMHFDLMYDPQRSHWSANIPSGTTDLQKWKHLKHPDIAEPVIGSWCGLLRKTDDTVITDIMRRIVLAYQQTQQSDCLISGLVLELLHFLMQAQEETRFSREQHIKMMDAMQSIKRSGASQVPVALLAKKFGMSASYFRSCFKDHFGQSPRQAMIQVQMETAMDYLCYSNLSISQIADELGFSTVHNFSRAFRRFSGNPPSHYR
jgi:AraC-like DNA-binding protein